MKLWVFVIAIVIFARTVLGKMFLIDNCVRMDVDGTVVIDAVRDGQTEFSVQVDLSKTPFTISGKCSKEDTSRSMTVHFNKSDSLVDWTLLFMTKDDQALLDQMIKFTPSSLFKNDKLSKDVVSLADTGSTLLSVTNASFLCKAEKSIPYDSAVAGKYNFTVSQVLRNLHVQAFNLAGKTFSPDEECSADQTSQATEPTTRQTTQPTTHPTTQPTTHPTTQPTTHPTTRLSTRHTTHPTTHSTTHPTTHPTTRQTTESTATSNATTSEITTASNVSGTTEFTTEPSTTGSTAQPTTVPTPSENTYVVNNTFGNVTCIVLRGDIAFTNIVYNLTNGEQATAGPISIPRMNPTTGNVKVSGACPVGNGSEKLIITFNGNWNLTLTFAGDSAETTPMLGAEQDEYSLHDIQFDYVLTPEFFPNASDRDAKKTAKAQNLTDFLKGSNGGSYKCNSKITKKLDNGVKLETTNLQYKAFNSDDDADFGDDVSECPADEGSDSTIPIAVGASLGGLILIMFIAYLIVRHRRSPRAGYDAL